MVGCCSTSSQLGLLASQAWPGLTPSCLLMAAGGGHAHGNRPGRDDDTLGIRISAVFVVLVAGMLGAGPPLFIKVPYTARKKLQGWINS